MAYFRKRGEKWSFTVDIGRDPSNGERRQVVRSGFSTKKDAEKACRDLLTEHERGVSVSVAKDTVGSFMREYLETTLRKEIERTTYEGKVSMLEKYIEPRIGKLKLQKTTQLDLQRFANELEEKDGLNPGTVRNIMRLVNQTFRTAYEWGFIAKNVASGVKKSGYKAKKHTVWTKDEWERFLQEARAFRFYPFYLIALNTGMRPGEILALTWDHVNLKQKYIRVDRTIEYTKENGIRIKESPKNDSSRRNVTIPESVINYLKKYKLEQGPNPLNLVVPGVKSDIVYNSALNKAMKSDIKKVGVPFITPHELRHTHATYLLSPKPFGLGISVKAVSERLGHANTTVTMNTYAHVLETMQEAIADALEESITKSVVK